MKKFYFEKSQILKNSLAVGLLCGTVLFSATAPISCKLTEEGIEVENRDSAAPEIESFKITGSKNLQLKCSEEFSISDLILKKEGDEDNETEETEIEKEAISFNETKTIADISFPVSTEIGKKYSISGVITDSHGNSLDFTKEFLGFNDNPAKIILSEIRCIPSKNIKSKAEFLEFKVIKGGNITGTEIDLGYNNMKYEFPNIEVKTDEIIVVHLQYHDSEENGFIDELEEDLTLAKASDSNDNARDLWIRCKMPYIPTDSYISTNNYISDTKDVIAIIDSVTGSAIDGILFTTNETNWSRKTQKTLASLMNDSGVWNGTTADTGFCIDSSTASKTIVRKNLSEVIAAYKEKNPAVISSTKDDWTLSTSATPGEI